MGVENRSLKKASKPSKPDVAPSAFTQFREGAGNIAEAIQGWGVPVVTGAWDMLANREWSPNSSKSDLRPSHDSISLRPSTSSFSLRGNFAKQTKKVLKKRSRRRSKRRRRRSRRKSKSKTPRKSKSSNRSSRRSSLKKSLSSKTLKARDTLTPPTLSLENKKVLKERVRPRTEIKTSLTSKDSVKTVQSDPLSRQNTNPKKKTANMPKLRRSFTQLLNEARHSRIQHKDIKMIKKIGQGAFGSVFAARNQSNMSTLAVKQIWLGGRGNNRTLTQTKREVDLLSKLNHENIVRYLGANKEDDNLYMYLELVEGGSLEDKMYPQGGRNKLSLHKAQDYGEQILTGLDYLHSNKVVHRDLKPGNVLLAQDGTLKLADFGASFDIANATLARNQTTVGTPHYMAPEVVIREKHTTASDMWSFGVMMFEMVTGKLPFESKNAPQLMCQLATGNVEVEWPRGLLPDNFRDLIEACLQSDPTKRPSPKALLKHPFFNKKIDDMEMTMSRFHTPSSRIMNNLENSESCLMTEYSMSNTRRMQWEYMGGIQEE